MLAKVFPLKLEELIAGQFADLIVEFIKIDHELLVSL